MKKILFGILAVALAALVGCTPDDTQIKQTATAIGYAAGLVANETPINDNARNTVVEVLTEVRSCIPADGQSFTDAWTPIIKEKVAALVAAGKIDEATGTLVASVAIMAAQGVDYLFDVRYPEAKKNASLVAAGASGAIDGFLVAFKSANCDDCTAKTAQQECDKEAYEWFKANLKQ